MPRAAKRDKATTQTMGFHDLRSFVAIDGRIFLHGLDIKFMRLRVYQRADGRCYECARKVRWDDGELHHVTERSKGGDDKESNLEWRCALHHRGPGGKHA